MKKTLFVAKAVEGHEYCYLYASAHRVPAASVNYILRVLNQYKYDLEPGQVWHVYDDDGYSIASDYAEQQRFTVYRGIVKDHRPAYA